MSSINLLFSHGYGVKKDSKGLFTAIADSLPDGFTPILFDYYHVDGKNITVRPPSEMIEILKQRYSELDGETWLIGHSMGCTLIAMSGLTPSKTLFLAPPLQISSRPVDFRQYFLSRHPDAREENGSVYITRKNGGIFCLTPEWFEELGHLTHGTPALNYMAHNDVSIIFGTEDLSTPIPEDDHDFWDLHKPVNTIPGNHNFNPPHRDKLVSTIIDILQS
jgi:hypothetical protein